MYTSYCEIISVDLLIFGNEELQLITYQKIKAYSQNNKITTPVYCGSILTKSYFCLE